MKRAKRIGLAKSARVQAPCEHPECHVSVYKIDPYVEGEATNDPWQPETQLLKRRGTSYERCSLDADDKRLGAVGAL